MVQAAFSRRFNETGSLKHVPPLPALSARSPGCAEEGDAFLLFAERINPSLFGTRDELETASPDGEVSPVSGAGEELSVNNSRKYTVSKRSKVKPLHSC